MTGLSVRKPAPVPGTPLNRRPARSCAPAAPEDRVKPHPDAKWVIFYSLGEGSDKGAYYDAHPIEHMSHHLTMLACDMNNEPLSFGHGAPLRLRTEIGVGFKQVKWIRGIEFVADFSEVGPATAATTKTTSSSATGNPSERPPC